MASNQIVKLLGVLFLVIGIAYFSGAFEEAPSTMDLPVVQVDIAAVNRIEIISPLHTVVTEKTASAWQMTQPVQWPADTLAISTFLDQLTELRLKSVVAISPDRYERYGVDSSAYVIRLTEGNVEHEITMSPNGPEFSTVYIRIGGDERVFTASPRLSIPYAVALWRDKRILSLAPVSVLSATVSTPDELYTVLRTSSGKGWVIRQSGSNTPSDSVAVSRWLTRFMSLKVDGFLDEDTEYADPTHFIEFQLVDGTSLRLDATREESRFVLTKGPGDDTIYYLIASRAEPLFPSSETLLKSE